MKYYLKVEITHTNSKNKLQKEMRERLYDEFHGTLCNDDNVRDSEIRKIIAMKHDLEKKHSRCRPLRHYGYYENDNHHRHDISNVGRVTFLPVKREVSNA